MFQSSANSKLDVTIVPFVIVSDQSSIVSAPNMQGGRINADARVIELCLVAYKLWYVV
jgi:hypothetical protein